MTRDGNQEPPVYVSTGRVAERLGVHKPTVANWVERVDGVPEPDAWLVTPGGAEWALYLNDGEALLQFGLERIRRQAEVAEQVATEKAQQAGRARTKERREHLRVIAGKAVTRAKALREYYESVQRHVDKGASQGGAGTSEE